MWGRSTRARRRGDRPRRFVPGSHAAQLAHAERPDPLNALSRGQSVERAWPEECWALAPLRAGEFSVHSFLAAHRSGPNKGTEDRVGFALRFLAAGVARQTGASTESATAFGPACPHFHREPALPFEPSAIELERGVAAHAAAMAAEAANYFRGSANVYR